MPITWTVSKSFVALRLIPEQFSAISNISGAAAHTPEHSNLPVSYARCYTPGKTQVCLRAASARYNVAIVGTESQAEQDSAGR